MHLASAHVLLDSQAVLRLFAAIPALARRPPRHAELAALWIKPGRHFNASYRLTMADEGAPVVASAFALGRARAATILEQLAAQHPATTVSAGCPHCASACGPPGLLLQLFPFDYRLPTLPACFDVNHVDRALGGAARIGAAEPAGYRPGMRCQVRYRAARSNLYGKVAVEREPGQAFALHGRLSAALADAGSGFRVAEPKRYVPELQLSLTAEAPGQSLHDALRAGRDVLGDVPRIAAALAGLHRLVMSGIDRVYTVDDELALVHGWVELVAEWYPELAGALAACETELLRTRPLTRPAQALVHRDFYDKQILMASDELTLLDLDTVCRGDPEIDLGNFGAQLVLRGLQFGRQRDCGVLEDRFLRAYPDAVAADRVRWYRRSALLRLACGYALRPHWHHLAPALVEEARRL